MAYTRLVSDRHTVGTANLHRPANVRVALERNVMSPDTRRCWTEAMQLTSRGSDPAFSPNGKGAKF